VRWTVWGVGFAEERFPFAVLLEVALLPDFAVVFELVLGFVEELPDFVEDEGCLFEDEAF
jgi:hypothetical protein